MTIKEAFAALNEAAPRNRGIHIDVQMNQISPGDIAVSYTVAVWTQYRHHHQISNAENLSETVASLVKELEPQSVPPKFDGDELDKQISEIRE